MYKLTLAERDLYLVHIDTLMDEKRKMLLEKQKTLQQTAKENEYLEMVRNDYRKYYNHIVKQKEDQINAMNYLKQYIDEIMVNGKLTDVDLENAKANENNKKAIIIVVGLFVLGLILAYVYIRRRQNS